MSKHRHLEHLRRPGDAAAGILAEAMRASALGVKGRVAVDIVDDASGRIVNRIEADNYVVISQWEAFARAIQKLAWTWGYQGDSTTVTVRSTDARDPRQIPTLRNDVIACWADSTAAATGDVWAYGEVVAWAHRWQQGSPSTRQGLVQPSLCTLADDEVSWVWEWATANGNGTFQSVGWRRLGYNSNSGDAILADLNLYSRRLVSTTGFTDAVSSNVSMTATLNSISYRLQPIYYDSGSGKLYGLTYGSSGFKLCSAAVTINADGNYAIGTFTDESGASIAAGLRGNTLATSTATPMGYCRLGSTGDWIAAGYSGTSTARRPEIRRVTTGGTVSYTNANGGTYTAESAFTDVTYDGTDLWVTAATAAGSHVIHRIDPATGTISATLSSITSVPAYFPAVATTTRGYASIEWDADNSWLWVTTTDGYTFNINTSGEWLGVLLKDSTNDYPIANSYLSGQHNNVRASTGGMLDVDTTRLVFNPTGSDQALSQTHPGGQSAEQAVVTQPTSPGRTRMFTMDGDIWHTINANATDGTPTGSDKFVARAFTELHNYSTRTLLDSAATKNNTQTMRITYTLSFT